MTQRSRRCLRLTWKLIKTHIKRDSHASDCFTCVGMEVRSERCGWETHTERKRDKERGSILTKHNCELSAFLLSDVMCEIKLSFFSFYDIAALIEPKSSISICSSAYVMWLKFPLQFWKTWLYQVAWKTISHEHKNVSCDFFFSKIHVRAWWSGG